MDNKRKKKGKPYKGTFAPRQNAHALSREKETELHTQGVASAVEGLPYVSLVLSSAQTLQAYVKWVLSIRKA